jgi:hypothetical protein
MAWKIAAEQPLESKPRESYPEFGLRNIARQGARAAETIVGLPGDIAQLGHSYLKATNPVYNVAFEKGGVPNILPSSENLRKLHENVTGEYLKPQSKSEERLDAFTSLVSSIISPTKGALGLLSKANIANTVRKIPRALKVGAAATLGGEAAKGLGAGELGQEITKAGILFASGIPGIAETLEKKANDAYKFVFDVPESAHIRTPNLQSAVDKINKYANSGHRTEDKELVGKFANSVENVIGKGDKLRGKNKVLIKKGPPVREIAQLEKDANQLIRDPKTPKQARPMLIDLKKDITSSLEDYGKKHPEWNRHYKDAKDIWRGLNDRSEVTQFLKKNFDLRDLLENKFAKAVLFGATALAPAKIGIPLAVGAGAANVLDGIELLAKSKNARSAYLDAIAAAVSNNRNAFIQSAKKLDKIAQKETPNPVKSKWKIT